MKRLLKFFAFLGGLGALGWLIRNRFVGVTFNREPQIPEPAPEPVVDPLPESDLLRIPDIAPADADLLHAQGVTTATQLAEADAAELAARTGLDEDRLTGWIQQAAVLV